MILDHYSSINFDNIKRIEVDCNYTKIFWKDMNKLRKKYLDKSISVRDPRDEEEKQIIRLFNSYSN